MVSPIFYVEHALTFLRSIVKGGSPIRIAITTEFDSSGNERTHILTHRVRRVTLLLRTRRLTPWTGGRIPAEDPDYESYTLGNSPESLRSTDTAVAATEDTRLSDLQLSDGADQRYLTTKVSQIAVMPSAKLTTTSGPAVRYATRLVGREKSKSRQESFNLPSYTFSPHVAPPQFHCSMTTMDQIQFLKETSVCRYLMVIHTPRLCAEPGFQSVREKQPAAPIHCREVIPKETFRTGTPPRAPTIICDPHTLHPKVQLQQATLPEAPYPNDVFYRNPSHLPDPSLQQKKKADAKAWGVEIPNITDMLGGDTIAKAIQKLLGKDVKVKSVGEPNTLAKAAGEPVDGVQEFDLTFGVPIQGEDGEEMYVQVLDLEGRQGQTPEELMQMVQDAVAAVKSYEGKGGKAMKYEDEDEEPSHDEL